MVIVVAVAVAVVVSGGMMVAELFMVRYVLELVEFIIENYFFIV